MADKSLKGPDTELSRQVVVTMLQNAQCVNWDNKPRMDAGVNAKIDDVLTKSIFTIKNA